MTQIFSKLIISLHSRYTLHYEGPRCDSGTEEFVGVTPRPWIPDRCPERREGWRRYDVGRWKPERVVFRGKANGPGWASACDGREILRFAQE